MIHIDESLDGIRRNDEELVQGVLSLSKVRTTVWDLHAVRTTVLSLSERGAGNDSTSTSSAK